MMISNDNIDVEAVEYQSVYWDHYYDYEEAWCWSYTDIWAEDDDDD